MTRALLVCAAVRPGSRELVAELAPSFDVVIGVDGGGSLCLDAGIVPTMLVGDFDSIEAEFLTKAVACGVTIRRFPADKDRTDLVLAIEQARELGVDRIAVTAATSARLDHTLGVLAALAGAADLQPQIVEPGLNGWVLSREGRCSVTLQGPGATVSVVPHTASARVSASGVRWPLEHADISDTETLGISNVVLGSSAVITVGEGVAFVLSPRTDAAPAHEPFRGLGETHGV
jgi:thiamine pyrophosphokinase